MQLIVCPCCYRSRSPRRRSHSKSHSRSRSPRRSRSDSRDRRYAVCWYDVKTFGTVVAVLLLFILYLAILSLIYLVPLFSGKRFVWGSFVGPLTMWDICFRVPCSWLNTVLRKVWTLWNCLSRWCVLMSDIITFRFVCFVIEWNCFICM